MERRLRKKSTLVACFLIAVLTLAACIAVLFARPAAVEAAGNAPVKAVLTQPIKKII